MIWACLDMTSASSRAWSCWALAQHFRPLGTLLDGETVARLVRHGESVTVDFRRVQHVATRVGLASVRRTLMTRKVVARRAVEKLYD